MTDDKKCAVCGATGELTRLKYKGKETPWLCPKCYKPAAEGIAEQVVNDIDDRLNNTQTKGDTVSTGTSINLQGVVHKTIVKPPKLDDDGHVESQDVEIVLRVPLGDGVRQKLADLSRLQNGQTTYIALQDAQFEFDMTGKKPEAKAPKAKKTNKKQAGDPTFDQPATA